MLHTQAIEAATLDLTRTLINDAELSAFNLVGGAADIEKWYILLYQ
ncbi:MAG: hypothetical protein ABIN01_22635 [Ferruginibacter sp.]